MQVFRGRDLEIQCRPIAPLDGRPELLDQVGVVGRDDSIDNRPLVRPDQQGAAKSLRSLRLPQCGARNRRHDRAPIADAAMVVEGATTANAAVAVDTVMVVNSLPGFAPTRCD